MRRVLALVLPQIACEVARERRLSSAGAARPGPLAVLLEPQAPGSPGAREVGEARPRAILDVVSDEARRYGIRPGQRVAEASALASHLEIRRVTHAELDLALGRVAELALAFGAPASIRLARPPAPRRRAGRAGRERTPESEAASSRHPAGEEPFDTVWVDVTASSHLFGGEEGLLEELCERVSSLGHRVRAAVADGPRLAQALARFGDGATIAAPSEGARALAPLPIQALPLDWQTASFLVRVGVMTVGDLARLPKASAAARLRSGAGSGKGASADEILALAAGFDPRPLVPFEPPRTIVEAIDFEDGALSAEALVFVLRGMVDRVSARLRARGEAASRIEITAPYDASVLRLERAEAGEARAGEARAAFSIELDLPAPLAGASDLLRPLRAKLERASLLAPVVSLRLEVPRIVPAARVQLDLSRGSAPSPDALPALLAELAAEIGEENVGLLEAGDSLRPEARSRLVPAGADWLSERPEPAARAEREGPEDPPGGAPVEPSRLLPEPLAIGGKVRKGSAVAIDKQLFVVEEIEPAARLDGVEWWTDAPASRDYARVWLSAGAPGSPSAVSGQALVFVDRSTGEAYLQGWCE